MPNRGPSSPSIGPARGASAAPAAAATPGAVAGNWAVATGSVVGYRVREQFVGQSSPHEAVARTSDVTGSVTVTQDSSGLTAANLTFTAQVGTLKSVDTVAGY